ncbi:MULTISPECIES: DeoR/GlpR family DNA-binding transcription regulator [Streptomyces]|nr:MULTISPECIES: DeoR/GlpR family DNA-binding transcription regulator [Streptomyces]UNZ02263.1 Glucitol operon repressor [Streptomyces rimosus subsp. rimosus]UTH93816.1 Glucitol operon repressor [Streptomyces rimosus subsp. rimosus]UTJ11911.1 Glucitol operon repressor [Streptomyces rimosus subsp. rimosus]
MSTVTLSTDLHTQRADRRKLAPDVLMCYISDMNVSERHRFILALLAERNRASVAELARSTKTSEMTIRRDLELLESRGALRRVHGGAVSTLLSGVEPPYAVRAMVGGETKAKLADVVVRMLNDGETVALDTGTTAVAVAHAMAGRRLTVTPLSLHATMPLAEHEGIRLLLPGGQVRPGELSFYGETALRTFEDLRYDTFILGCCGVDAANGATAYNLDDVHVKRVAARAARRIILVATAEKLGRVALGRICSVEQLDVVVTDAPQGTPVVEEMRAAGVNIVHV